MTRGQSEERSRPGLVMAKTGPETSRPQASTTCRRTPPNWAHSQREAQAFEAAGPAERRLVHTFRPSDRFETATARGNRPAGDQSRCAVYATRSLGRIIAPISQNRGRNNRTDEDTQWPFPIDITPRVMSNTAKVAPNKKAMNVSSFARDSLLARLRATVGQPNHPDGVVAGLTAIA